MLFDRLAELTYQRLLDLATFRFNGGEADRVTGIRSAMEYLAYNFADRPVWDAEVARVLSGGQDEVNGFVRALLDEQLVMFEHSLRVPRERQAADQRLGGEAH